MKLFHLSFLVLATFTAAISAGTLFSYAPTINVACPSSSLVRKVDSRDNLDGREVKYISSRQTVIKETFQKWIGDGSALGYRPFPALQGKGLSNAGNLPKIGLATSGGGFRAAQYSAGVFNAFDGRNPRSVAAGTGGIYQVASYTAAASGGAWFQTSFIFNDFPMVIDLVLGNAKLNKSGWLLQLDLASPGGQNLTALGNQAFLGAIFESLLAKSQQGFNVSITDAWSRALSYHFLPGTTLTNFFDNTTAHGAGLLYSSVPDLPAFRSGQMPYPLITVDSRPFNFPITTQFQNPLPLNETVYEITPFEYGSWDLALRAFAELEFAGSKMVNGKPANKTKCVKGFDQVGYIVGTTSGLFHQVLAPVQNPSTTFSAPSPETIATLQAIIQELEVAANTSAIDVADWPNAFFGVNPSTFVDSVSSMLSLVDGGGNGEEIPISSLLIRQRNVDVIVAIDGSADDVNQWPEGKTLYFTQNRTNTILKDVAQPLPPIPPNQSDFLTLGLNQRPTFFGCDPIHNPPEWPLLIYLPNAPPINGSSPVANPTTFTFSSTVKHTELFLEAAFLTATQGWTPNKTTPDKDFGKCLQCAAIDRLRLNSKPTIKRSDFCQDCFDRYCFNANSKTPVPGKVVGRNLTFVDPGA